MLVVLLGALAYGLYVWLASGDDASKAVQKDTPPAATGRTGAGAERPSVVEADGLSPGSEERLQSAQAEPAEVAVAEGSGQAPAEPSEADDQGSQPAAAPDAERRTTEPEVVASSPAGTDSEIPTSGDEDAMLASDSGPVATAGERVPAAEDLNPEVDSEGDVESISLDRWAPNPGEEGAVEAREQLPEPREPAAPPPPKAVFEAREIVVASPSVQRFSLARAIKSREPVSDLDAVRFNAEGLAAVYAFSEVEGLPGATLYYHWIHEGKEVAVVAIRVGAKRWRSHSSKYVKETMTGTWSVQLRDADGKRLAEAKFVVHPPGAVDGR